MKRSDSLTVRIRPELKEGFKELFRGNLVSNAFEHLVWNEIASRYKQCKRDYDGNREALAAYMSTGNVVPSVKEAMEYNIDLNERAMKRLDRIREQSFPDGMSFEKLKDDQESELKDSQMVLI